MTNNVRPLRLADPPEDDRPWPESSPPEELEIEMPAPAGDGASRTRIATTAVDLLAFPLTDSGNAERLVALHGADLRYVPVWGKWMAFSRSYWVPDQGAVYRAAKAMVREFMAQANAVADENRRKSLLAYGLACESRKLLDAMVALARHEKPVLAKHEDFDRDPMLFNTKNGTIDLRTGKLRPHRREDLLTKISPVVYDEHAECPRFDRYLLEVMAGDGELVTFLVRFLGYCLTGDVREHVLTFWHGKGGNGKGVLGAVLLGVFGNYAIKAAPDLLFRSAHTDRHPTELADLHGVRLAICNETTGGRSWDEGTLKDISGGDRIRARRMREDHWEFDPTHKLVVWGNHKPTIKTVDDAMRRRLRLIPFAVSFVGREDKGLLPALLAEGPGILRTLVEGCLAWQRDGLPDAAAVRESTEGYLRDEDTLGQFLDAECVFAPDARTTRKALRDRYVAWADERGEKPVDAKAFAKVVRERDGVQDRKVRNEKSKPVDGWHGLGLRSPEEASDGTP